jgi:hypothetical protein
MAEGLLQKSAVSFWAPYKGKTFDSVVMVANEISAKAGHTVVFDFDGNLSGRPVKGNTTAKGTGEQKKKFSDKLTVSDYRWVVDNGTKFDGVEIGDLSINEHSDSRNKLADLWVRSEDQAFFDLGQQEAEFGLTFAATDFNLDAILKIEQVVKTGTGFDTYPAGLSRRLPLKPFKLQNGEPVWIFLLDVSMKAAFLRQAGAGAILKDADVRGNDNRLIKGVIGKIGSFLFVEAPVFFGETVGAITTNGYYNYENTGVEVSGLRQQDTNGNWTGQEGFDGTAVSLSRGLVLGAGAFQKANGMMPDYKYEGTDFDKFSESCMEAWCAAKPSKLLAENSDYADGKVAGYNYGIVAVDVTL